MWGPKLPIRTARGNAERGRVDQVACETRRSHYHFGKCDVIEFRPDGTVYPVGHKYGVRKKRSNDDRLPAAPPLCLEELLGRPVTHGAIYHRDGLAGFPRSFADYRVVAHKERLPNGVELVCKC